MTALRKRLLAAAGIWHHPLGHPEGALLREAEARIAEFEAVTTDVLAAVSRGHEHEIDEALDRLASVRDEASERSWICLGIDLPWRVADHNASYGEFETRDQAEAFLAAMRAENDGHSVRADLHPEQTSDLCECGHWSRHHVTGKHGGCGHCDCQGFSPEAITQPPSHDWYDDLKPGPNLTRKLVGKSVVITGDPEIGERDLDHARREAE